MKRNRRSHYRILHVQPEAPFEIIRACYQTLTGELGMHADKGGDAETVAHIEEAWDVLSDPAKRVAYDRSLRLAAQRGANPDLSEPAPKLSALAAPTKARAIEPPKEVKKLVAPVSTQPSAKATDCPFCAKPLPLRIMRETRCGGCSSPLAPISQPERKSNDFLDRRGGVRTESELAMTVYATAQGGPLPARLKDLSTGGASLVVSNAVHEGQVIRLVSRQFDALARVVSARRKGQEWIVGSRLVTLLFLR